MLVFWPCGDARRGGGLGGHLERPIEPQDPLAMQVVRPLLQQGRPVRLPSTFLHRPLPALPPPRTSDMRRRAKARARGADAHPVPPPQTSCPSTLRHAHPGRPCARAPGRRHPTTGAHPRRVRSARGPRRDARACCTTPDARPRGRARNPPRAPPLPSSSLRAQAPASDPPLLAPTCGDGKLGIWLENALPRTFPTNTILKPQFYRTSRKSV